jgi:dipeptidyl aminopeptidase/acylaminoacyl peptidase
MLSSPRAKLLLLTFALVLLGVLGSVAAGRLSSSNMLSGDLAGEVENESRMNGGNALLDDDPFASMTIPYLRSREYTSQLGERELIAEYAQYSSYLTSYTSDGLRINGLLTIPAGQPPQGGWPAVVFVHGYIPPAQYRTQERYAEYISYLARRGFVVFKIDLRGHGESEGEASGAYYSGDYVIDTLNAHAALSASDIVNSSKIGLWGHSMAGNVVLRSLVAKQTIPAAVIWGGAVFTYQDFREFGISDASYQRPYLTDTERSRNRQRLFETHGEFDPEHPLWKTIIPTNYLDGVQGALQLHHAENDDVVSVKYSTNLDAVLDSSSLAHEVFLYPSGGHNITGNSFTQAMQRTVEFYEAQFELER